MMLLEELQNYKIYLCSKSPRRHELLTEMGLDYEYLSTDVVEKHPDTSDPVVVAEYLSQLKLSPVRMDEYPDHTVFIACDTIVVMGNDILEKPKDKDDAVRMLHQLSGDVHTVISGLTVATPRMQFTSHQKTSVRFAALSDEEISYYVEHYQPFDKAGAYGVQEWIGNVAIESIEGSFYNVMGLPTCLLWKMLKKLTAEMCDR